MTHLLPSVKLVYLDQPLVRITGIKELEKRSSASVTLL